MVFPDYEVENVSLNPDFKKFNEPSDQPIDFEKSGFLSMILRNLNLF